jgi:hypothetical protein
MRELFGFVAIGIVLVIYWQVVGPELQDFWYWLGWVVSGVLGWLAYGLVAGKIGLRSAGHN